MEYETPLEPADYEAAMMGYVTVMLIVSAVFAVFSIVCMWKIFKKAGKPGWHSIIPLLNTYDMFAISWKGINFIAVLILSVVIGFLSSLLQRGITTPFILLMYTVALITLFVVECMALYYLAKSFGYGVVMFLGLLFLTPIFLPILAFGRAQYIGPKGEPTGSVYDIMSKYRQSEGKYGGYGDYSQETYRSGSSVDNDPYHTYGQYHPQTPSQGFQAQGSPQPQQQFQSQGYRQQGFQQQGFQQQGYQQQGYQQQGFQQPQQQNNPFENSDYGRYQ